ncbi:unnamed protein product [Bursaphelenchus okinawaensis]|uniref:Uncharacterized protein n=1 Tax=Bursaphelenchus okinawaensis TaxID=465554 RepID=A0A811JSD0_9BILA|nr:unnamed protein product [Bursaphelenchus okinawaensis]CAG9081420.1 unnamed protein product [Bursaphelenchus okinawaensis]
MQIKRALQEAEFMKRSSRSDAVEIRAFGNECGQAAPARINSSPSIPGFVFWASGHGRQKWPLHTSPQGINSRIWSRNSPGEQQNGRSAFRRAKST